MQIPLELNYHDVDRSEWSENLIRERADRLERYSDEIVSCHVIVSRPHHHQHKGNPFKVTIEARLPRNRRLVVNEEPAIVEQESKLSVVINAAFDAMQRRLGRTGGDHRRDALAPSEEENRALVVRLFPEEGYGFLRTVDGREFYFHQHAVLNGDFPRLAVGTEVRFEPSMGEQGPQASTVRIVNKPGKRETSETADREDVPVGWRSTS